MNAALDRHFKDSGLDPSLNPKSNNFGTGLSD